MIGIYYRSLAIPVNNFHFLQMTITADSFDMRLQDKIYFTLTSQLKYFFGRIGCAAEGITTMDEGNFFGNISEKDRPVERRIPAACQHNFTSTVSLWIFYKIGYALAFKFFQMIDSRLARFKAAKSACNYHYLAVHFGTITGLGNKSAVFQL